MGTVSKRRKDRSGWEKGGGNIEQKKRKKVGNRCDRCEQRVFGQSRFRREKRALRKRTWKGKLEEDTATSSRTAHRPAPTLDCHTPLLLLRTLSRPSPCLFRTPSHSSPSRPSPFPYRAPALVREPVDPRRRSDSSSKVVEEVLLETTPTREGASPLYPCPSPALELQTRPFLLSHPARSRPVPSPWLLLCPLSTSPPLPFLGSHPARARDLARVTVRTREGSSRGKLSGRRLGGRVPSLLQRRRWM